VFAAHVKAGDPAVEPNKVMLVEPVEMSSGLAHESYTGAGAPQSFAAKMAQSASQAVSQQDAM
jgi:hypothetical protein